MWFEELLDMWGTVLDGADLVIGKRIVLTVRLCRESQPEKIKTQVVVTQTETPTKQKKGFKRWFGGRKVF